MLFYWEHAIEKHIFITHERGAVNSGGEANTEECSGTCFVIYDFLSVCLCACVCVFMIVQLEKWVCRVQRVASD